MGGLETYVDSINGTDSVACYDTYQSMINYGIKVRNVPPRMGTRRQSVLRLSQCQIVCCCDGLVYTHVALNLQLLFAN
jgi:hypothetical protein